MTKFILQAQSTPEAEPINAGRWSQITDCFKCKIQ